MRSDVKAKIVRIGNSRGIRLPKPVIEQCNLEGEVDLRVRGRTLIIEATHRARHGWDAAFAEMAARGDDRLLDAEGPPSAWDEAEWRW
jgi:antitoxin MazE